MDEKHTLLEKTSGEQEAKLEVWRGSDQLIAVDGPSLLLCGFYVFTKRVEKESSGQGYY